MTSGLSLRRDPAILILERAVVARRAGELLVEGCGQTVEAGVGSIVSIIARSWAGDGREAHGGGRQGLRWGAVRDVQADDFTREVVKGSGVVEVGFEI
jgi:hypothetical protein